MPGANSGRDLTRPINSPYLAIPLSNASKNLYCHCDSGVVWFSGGRFSHAS